MQLSDFYVFICGLVTWRRVEVQMATIFDGVPDMILRGGTATLATKLLGSFDPTLAPALHSIYIPI
jgi:hypothetical protein